jgi:hypothetical protein
VICGLTGFVAAIRGTRDVDDAAFVNLPATLGCEKRKNAGPRRKTWLECATDFANFAPDCRFI